jgi:uncharacterized protein
MIDLTGTSLQRLKKGIQLPMWLRLLIPAACWLAPLFVVGVARGQYSRSYITRQIITSASNTNSAATPSISVSGHGEVRAKPNVIEIDLQTVGSAELTNDAVVKYQDAKRRTLQAFAALKIKNLEIEEGGLAIVSATSREQMQMMMQGRLQNQKTKTPVEISARLHLRITGVQEMSPAKMVEVVGQLLDLAKDCDALPKQELNQMYNRYAEEEDAGNSLARFALTDFSALREQAYKQAVANARTKAQRLADLNHVKLAGVLSVQEIYVSGDDEQPHTSTVTEKTAATNLRIVSSRFSEIPVQVMLNVSFAIEPAEPAKP